MMLHVYTFISLTFYIIMKLDLLTSLKCNLVYLYTAVYEEKGEIIDNGILLHGWSILSSKGPIYGMSYINHKFIKLNYI